MYDSYRLFNSNVHALYSASTKDSDQLFSSFENILILYKDFLWTTDLFYVFHIWIWYFAKQETFQTITYRRPNELGDQLTYQRSPTNDIEGFVALSKKLAQLMNIFRTTEYFFSLIMTRAGGLKIWFACLDKVVKNRNLKAVFHYQK